jgi:2,3-bisphosphoglycerate-independent phosphoglycerate mutase
MSTKAPICEGEYCWPRIEILARDEALWLTSGLDPGVAVGSADDLVGELLEVLLGRGVLEAAADQALRREDCVFRVGDGLIYNNIISNFPPQVKRGVLPGA